MAGYRGLPKALIYGASKAAVINFTETLYLDLHPKGLGVYLIMPGFVKTPLTDGNDFKMPHLISAEEAAQEIVAGLRAGKFEIHFPRAFTRQLKFLRLLPYRWYFYLCARRPDCRPRFARRGPIWTQVTDSAIIYGCGELAQLVRAVES